MTAPLTRRKFEAVCNHTFRATGITAYLDMAARLKTRRLSAPRESTHDKLYDRTENQITLDEVRRLELTRR